MLIIIITTTATINISKKHFFSYNKMYSCLEFFLTIEIRTPGCPQRNDTIFQQHTAHKAFGADFYVIYRLKSRKSLPLGKKNQLCLRYIL